jgi:peptidyl-prolyl cis-trans isomerase A (cyclophilin A)
MSSTKGEKTTMNGSKQVATGVAVILLMAMGAGAADSKSKPAAKAVPAASTASTAKKVDSTKLLSPSKLTAKAPDVFSARFETSKGPFVIEVHRAWSPHGADRFYNLVSNGYYDDVRFFRVISGFMAQFGIHGNPAVNAAWQPAGIPDDPVTQSNKRGMVSYAMRGPGTRTNQIFINYVDGNAQLDGMGFSPFGKVTEGMAIVDALYSGYGEGAPSGAGPDQGRLQSEGNAYLAKDFPRLDYIKTARIVTK